MLDVALVGPWVVAIGTMAAEPDPKGPESPKDPFARTPGPEAGSEAGAESDPNYEDPWGEGGESVIWDGGSDDDEPVDPDAEVPDSEVPPRYNQWGFDIAPEGMYNFGGTEQYRTYGAGARFNMWNRAWRANLLIGGGASLHYTYLRDARGPDHLHLMTVNGDMIVGGGVPDRVAAYGHLAFGLGVIGKKDAATGQVLLGLGARALAGFGIYGFVAPRVTLGVLVDAGWFFGLGVDGFVTIGFHLGKKRR